MKITRDEFHRTKEESEYELFLQGIKANGTKQKYTRILRRILCDILKDFLSVDIEERAKQFANHVRDDTCEAYHSTFEESISESNYDSLVIRIVDVSKSNQTRT